MNDKSKYTTKARQDLKNMGIQSELWLGQNKNEKCSKPQAKYPFTPENRKKFCQFIKRVKLLDGFGSNFKHKVTDNDSNITALKSHDCHIMMHCLLHYGLQQYLPSSVATPIIELCSLFKQICSRTLMEDDMVKAQSKVIDILCNLELIYPHAFFNIMIHLVIHLPLEALEGGLIPPGGGGFNGVRFVVHSRDERRTTQNSGICSPGEMDREMYYGQLEEILDFSYMSFKVVLFRVKWFDTRNEGRKIKRFVIRNNITQIWARDIIDVDEDDDLIDDEDALPHDLADSDDEDLANDDDDDVAMSADVARGHGGDGGGDDRPPPRQIDVARGHGDDGGDDDRPLLGKGTRKPNRGGKKADRLDTRMKSKNLGLRRITDQWGPYQIRFEFNYRGTLMLLGDHATHWSSLLWEIVREFPMHYPSWRNIGPERKAGFDLTPHMQSPFWLKIQKGIEQQLAKIYTDNKSALKHEHWVLKPDETPDEEGIRSRRPSNIIPTDWDKQIAFWLDHKNLAQAAQNARNRAKSTVICRQGSQSLAVLRDMQMESSATREYPSLIQTYFDTHTVDGVFLRDEERLLYEEMLRLKDLGPNTPSGVPYTEDEIMAMVCRGKQRGHILVRSDDKMSQLLTQLKSQHGVGSGSGSGGGEDDEPGEDEDAVGDEDS
ncbi:retrotransposon protein, putative, ty3-gypsy subclass [Tanacetum coccineum]|uniref:Retrotransposon protein, putative, ty3-gypsy subclass n=1 Tax=Tanacetum coccineum TaxID=301880 RepID=A0ABQ5CBL8_9ASTR